MSDDTPLDPLRRAHEEDFFHKRNQELIEKLRKKLAAEETAEGLKAATHIQDDELLQHLARLGVTQHTLPVLHLVPLLQVAWADGEIQAEERVLLQQAADEANVQGEARAAFEEMLKNKPSQEFFDAALDFIRAMLAAMPADRAAAAKANLESLAWRVADAAGGLFGLFGRVEGAEKGALQDITRRLTGRSDKVLDKL
ncbi:MAG: hypothetical protein R3F60_07725 [bacterium]